jgi:hypothetical protein
VSKEGDTLPKPNHIITNSITNIISKATHKSFHMRQLIHLTKRKEELEQFAKRSHISSIDDVELPKIYAKNHNFIRGRQHSISSFSKNDLMSLMNRVRRKLDNNLMPNLSYQ